MWTAISRVLMFVVLLFPGRVDDPAEGKRPVPDDDDRAAEPDLAIDAVEYRLVWQHANAWG